MSNTVTTMGPLIATTVPMTGSDVNFTFNAKTIHVWIQASAATSSMYLASASSGNAGFVLPNGQQSSPLDFFTHDLAGRTVTFNGSGSTNVNIVEELSSI